MGRWTLLLGDGGLHGHCRAGVEGRGQGTWLYEAASSINDLRLHRLETTPEAAHGSKSWRERRVYICIYCIRRYKETTEVEEEPPRLMVFN